MLRTIIETADGSHSLYVQELGERYHSIHGAIQESKHVFIQSGFKQCIPPLVATVSVNILEIGLGTGLNALLTLIESEQSGIKIDYTTIEAYPLEKKLTEQLNYIELLEAESFRNYFDTMHSSEWNRAIQLTERFLLNKLHTTLEEAEFKPKFDLVYFDAFGPRVQPEMWAEHLFKKIFDAMKVGACLVTYCAQGEVKRTMKRAGFTVEGIQGPPGKREMVRAWKR